MGIVVVGLLLVLFFSGCSTIKEFVQDQAAYILCIEGRAWLYGGGDVRIVSVKDNFWGYVVVNEECEVQIGKGYIHVSELQYPEFEEGGGRF